MKTRIFRLIVGSLVMGFGISLALHSGLGVDPMALFWEGLNIQTGLSYGMLNLLITLLFIVIIYFLDKKQLGVGTIVNSVLVSLMLDVSASWMVIPNHVFSQSMMFVVGLILMAFGIAYYGKAMFGRGAYDGFMFALLEHLTISIRLLRTIMDFVLVVMGMVLGAKLTIGPIISVLVLGIMIQFFYVRITNVA